MDDGHTGTDANRENFQRLLADVMSGKINCVVVKDLSRFARNYSDAGSLIDNLFVQMGVRFISLAEMWTALQTRTAFPALSSPLRM